MSETVHLVESSYTRHLAAAIAELLRVLNHHTAKDGALEWPADADSVLVSLSAALSRMPQLLEQVGGWLRGETEAGRVRVTHRVYQGEPDWAVAHVVQLLDEAQAALKVAWGRLNTAQQITATIAGVET